MEEDKKFKNITFHCPVELVERIDRLAEKGDLPRSKLIFNLVEIGVDYLEATEKVGILQLAILIRDAEGLLKTASKKWKERKSLNGLTDDGKIMT